MTVTYDASHAATENASAYPLTHPRILYQNLARDVGSTLSDVIASSEISGAPRDAPLRPDLAEYWEPSAMNATWELDLGADYTINAIGIAGHNCGTKNCSVLAQTETFAGGGFTTFAQSVAPADDSPILFLDDNRSHGRVRLTFTGASVIRVASIYVGAVLKCARPLYGGHAPIVLSRSTELQTSMSRNGLFLGQSLRKNGFSTSAKLSHLTAAWYRANFDPFVKEALRYPYFWAWRPSGNYQNECVYAWTDEDIRPSNMGKRDFLEVTWNMVADGSYEP